MEETIRIVIPFLLDHPYAFPVLLHDCGLRGLKGTISGRHALLEDYVSLANSSDRNFLISEMSRSEQKRSLPASLAMGRPPSTPLPAILETFAK
jgi:hypothetical protein